MSSLTLYEFPDFKGDSCFIDKKIPNLASVEFLKKAQSLKITGDPWIVFIDVDYKGDFKCFHHGGHKSIPEFANKISSVRCVKGGLNNPKITLFEDCFYGGRSLPLDKAASSLKPRSFANITSSHKVSSGAWELYSEEHYQGGATVCVAGDEIPDYHYWKPKDKDDTPNSLRPVVDSGTSK